MNLFDLFAKISLDTSDYEKGLDDASGKTSSFADKLKNGLATAAKVGAAALTAAASGVAFLTKSSLEQYAEYEQLVGGVETLFKQSADIVQQYADNAYKTAGMSANEYMDTVTSFSASLLQGLGGDTAKAAEVANQAITDMSDNANKMGTSMQMIQNAYQGFAKQNYTMLDNLKLGYGGTQEEMARLINDSGVLGDAFVATANNINEVSFDKIIEAIHVVQTNMGVTGTTAAEAASTIEGSVASAKSAWTNLITGIADENADLDTLIGNFVTSAETVAGNVVPRITQILSGMGTAIEQLAPILAAEVPTLIASVLPSIVNGGAQLLVGLVTGLVSALPQLVAAVPGIIDTMITSISEALPQILNVGVQLLDQLTTGIETGLPDMVSRIPEIITQFLNYITEQLPTVLDKGAELLNNLVNGILGAIPEMTAALPEIITAFVQFITDNLPTIIESGINILLNLVSGIIGAIPDLVASIPQIISAITTGIARALPKIIQSGVSLLQKFIEGILSNIPALVAALPQIISAIVEGIGALIGGIVDVGKSIVEGIWKGIQEMAGWIYDKVTGFFSGIVDGVKDFLGIHSPSTVFADMGKNMALGLGQGWDNEYDRIRRDIEGGMDFGTASVDFASSGLGVASAGMVNGVSASVQGAGMSGGSITVNLMMPDGTKFASYLLGPLSNYAKANGTPILHPT
jgi:phage-related protein|nr:MAG TPA: tail tape measure protein [Caudoviricetes sp.]